MSPCVHRFSTAPSIPCWVKLLMPKRQKPMCETDEYADHPFQVLLREADERGVDDVDGPEDGHRRRRPLRRLRQHRVIDPQDAVDAHLEEHAGQDDRDGRVGLRRARRAARCGTGTSESSPRTRRTAPPSATRMKLRPSTAGAEANPPLRPHSASLSRLKLCIVWPSTGTVGPVEVEADDGEQHQHRAGQGVEEELMAAYSLRARRPDAMRKYIGRSITSQKT